MPDNGKACAKDGHPPAGSWKWRAGWLLAAGAIRVKQLLGELGRAPHLGCANRREISGVAEKERPIAANPIMKLDRTRCCVRFEVGGCVANSEAHLTYPIFEIVVYGVADSPSYLQKQYFECIFVVRQQDAP